MLIEHRRVQNTRYRVPKTVELRSEPLPLSGAMGDTVSRPSITVVVTSYNYERYLAVAMDSIYAQTDPADQVIVVDDGSTDGSRAVLRGYADRATMILQDNAGQGAAFNAAWKHVTSDVVVFLDADDALLPDALRTVREAWSTDLSKVHWQMQVIDASGEVTARLQPPKEPPTGDLRPVVTQRGPDEVAFASPPTSGNAFARAALDPAFPIDATRWRTDADTVLLTVAPLWGPVLRWQTPLSQYRYHGDNASIRRRGRDALVRARDLVTASVELLERLSPDVTSEVARTWLDESWALRLLILWDMIVDAVPAEAAVVIWDDWWTGWADVDGRCLHRPWDDVAPAVTLHVIPWWQESDLVGSVISASAGGTVLDVRDVDAASTSADDYRRATRSSTSARSAAT